jgi:hypothetical protein
MAVSGPRQPKPDFENQNKHLISNQKPEPLINNHF